MDAYSRMLAALAYHTAPAVNRDYSLSPVIVPAVGEALSTRIDALSPAEQSRYSTNVTNAHHTAAWMQRVA